MSTAAKKCIPRGRRSNHIPCWDAECEDLYQHFLQSPGGPDSDRAATALLTRLDGKRRNRWSETVRSIDFSHSSRLAWNTINNLTGRSRQSPRQCPVSADAIASQLVKNGKYEGVNRRSFYRKCLTFGGLSNYILRMSPGVSPIGSSLLPSTFKTRQSSWT